jgi:hypothetical protein
MSFWSQIEAKVKSAAVAALLASLAIALLNALVGDDALLGSLPSWLQFIVITVVPAVVTFLAGYKAKHTAKPPVVTRMHRP